MAKKIDMIGFKSDKLTVIEETSPDNGARWKCKCECGKEIIVRGGTLRSPKAPKSCGCERTRKLIEYNKKYNIKDITNQRFGSLVAQEMTDKRSNIGSVIWKCKCDCGKEVLIPSADLCSGNTKSCGCGRHKSLGEDKIITLLKEYNIPFVQEYSFKDLKFEDTQYYARFDFYVNNSYLIEYDGIQHFVQGQGVYDNIDKFKRTQYHDQVKNNYCLERNIPLIRIPYTELNNLTIEMLQPSTSPYLI